MSETQKPDPGGAAQSPRDPVSGQVKGNIEDGRTKPDSDEDQRKSPTGVRDSGKR